jgi:selenide,water dikinase
MLILNDIGPELVDADAARSITDVTGFGLLGHLIEMCEASGVSAEIEYAKVPRIDSLQKYIEQQSFPGGTARNFASYGHKASAMADEARNVLCDPQTSGGLLVAVASDRRNAFLEVAARRKLELTSFGTLTEKTEFAVTVV